MDTSLVQMIEQDGIEKEYVKSPFRFHDGIRAVLDNSCVSCSPDLAHSDEHGKIPTTTYPTYLNTCINVPFCQFLEKVATRRLSPVDGRKTSK